MGFALAEAAVQLGAQVTLIAGPVQLATPTGVKRIDVVTADQMYQVAVAQAIGVSIFIGCAAVADYKVAQVATQKLKKTSDDSTSLTLVKNPDIIAAVAALTSQRPFTVGFAAETQDVANYARQKLAKKKLDLICANDVSVQGQGFNSEHNALSVFWADGEQQFGLQAKTELAQQLLLLINERYLHEKSH